MSEGAGLCDFGPQTSDPLEASIVVGRQEEGEFQKVMPCNAGQSR